MQTIRNSDKVSPIARFGEMPVFLQLFSIYALMNVIGFIFILNAAAVSLSMANWGFTMGMHGFPLIIVGAYLFHGNRHVLRKIAYIMAVIVVTSLMSLGIYFFFKREGITALPQQYFLPVSLLAIAVQVFWIFMVMSAGMKKWMNEKTSEREILDGIQPPPNAFQTMLLATQYAASGGKDSSHELRKLSKNLQYSCIVAGIISLGFLIWIFSTSIPFMRPLSTTVLQQRYTQELRTLPAAIKIETLQSLKYFSHPTNFMDVLIVSALWLIVLSGGLYLVTGRFSRGLILDRITISYLQRSGNILIALPGLELIITVQKISKLSALPADMSGVLLMGYTMLFLALGQILVGYLILISCRILENARQMKEEAELTI